MKIYVWNNKIVSKVAFHPFDLWQYPPPQTFDITWRKKLSRVKKKLLAEFNIRSLGQQTLYAYEISSDCGLLIGDNSIALINNFNC